MRDLISIRRYSATHAHSSAHGGGTDSQGNARKGGRSYDISSTDGITLAEPIIHVKDGVAFTKIGERLLASSISGVEEMTCEFCKGKGKRTPEATEETPDPPAKVCTICNGSGNIDTAAEIAAKRKRKS